MSVQETPKKVRRDVERVIADLNEAWPGLGLPSRRDSDWDRASPLARSCYGRIKYICFRPHIDLQRVIKLFNIRAKREASAWVEKPSQEEGTIASRPLPQTFIKRETLALSGISVALQQNLLRILEGILQDEEQLADESKLEKDSGGEYERHPPPGHHLECCQLAQLSGTISEDYASGSPKRERSQSPSPEMASKRQRSMTKGKTIKAASSNKTIKMGMDSGKRVQPTNRSIKDFLQAAIKPMQHQRILSGSKNTNVTPQTSFTTTGSPEHGVFMPSPEDHVSSDTTITSLDGMSATQDLLLSQDVSDILNDPTIRRSIEDCKMASTPQVEGELRDWGPFSSQNSELPARVSFAYRYEIHRLAEALKLTPVQLFKAIEQLHHMRRPRVSKEPSYDEIWEVVKSIVAEKKIVLPEKTSQQAWKVAQTTQNHFEDAETGRTVTFSGHLLWASPGQKGLFKLKLQPPKLDKSCRFHRRFGPDRFIVLTMPFFEYSQIPKHIRIAHGKFDLFEIINSWIAQTLHGIAGRDWRVFYNEAEKGEKKKRNDGGKKLKVHMFAVNGIDFDLVWRSVSETSTWREDKQHKPLKIEDFADWHLRFQDNQDSTDLKSFSRFSLGLSKTTPTVVLERTEFIRLPDVRGQTVMNDGCAMMSLELAKRVAKHLGLKDDDKLPSAFQGRIGGAKGLWIVDFLNTVCHNGKRKFWIQIADSQLKIKPHSCEIYDADPEQRMFEVLKYSNQATPARLNPQLLHILDHHEVSRGALEKLLLADVEEYSESLFAAIKDPYKLRQWIQIYHRSPRGAEPVKLLGSFPYAKEEKVNLLLESGFVAPECALLSELTTSFVMDEMNQYVEKLRIRLPNSTSLFCIADPYGVLDEGEVHLGFSKLWKSPLTGLSDFGIDNIDVLVARNPAHLPSDIQKVRAVFKQELRFTLWGDYDGDTVWVCWEPAIVQGFSNSTPPEDISPENCGLEQKSRRISDVFESSVPPTQGIDNFLSNCISFNSHQSLLGVCTNEHEKLIYCGRADLSSPNARKLAAFVSFLVDASKQGYLLVDETWHKLRKQICGDIALATPAYKGDVAPPKVSTGHYGGFQDVIDWLKFGVAVEEKDRVLARFEAVVKKDRRTYDPTLTKMWADLKKRINPKDLSHTDLALKTMLERLEKDVRAVETKYSKPIDPESDRFAWAVEDLHEDFLAIKPAEVDHEIYDRFLEERELQFSYWTALRASCAFNYFNKSRFCWFMAGFDLCKMKAEHQGRTRIMTTKMHHLYKLDSKLTDKITGVVRENVDDEDDFSIEEDDQYLVDGWIS